MKCRLCAGSLTLALPLNPLPPVENFVKEKTEQALTPCDLYLCDDCRHAQLVDVIPPEKLFTQYLFRTGDNPELVEHYKAYARDCGTPRFVVEIGSNDGTLLKMFDCHVLGVDPSDAAKALYPHMSGFFSECLAKEIVALHGQPDLILANHVFAHSDDLLGMIRGVKLLLAPEGRFIFEAAYLLDMLTNGYYDTIYHEHLSYHSIRPLILALKSCGLYIHEVSHNDCKGGSIRCVVTHEEDGAIVEMEPEVTLESFAFIRERIKRHREAVAGIPEMIGCGASASAVATMYQLGIESRLKFLVDDNPRKQGLFSPGANIEVKPSSALYETDLPIVVLATRYEDAFMRKHPDLESRFVRLP